MGRQIGFYMTSADERCFVAALQAEDDVVVAFNHFPTSEPEILRALPPTSGAASKDTNLSIYNRAIAPKLVVYEVGTRGEFALDLTRSDVIQFTRSFVRADGKLEPGRLWYDDETMRGKSKRKVFLAWAQGVFRLIKKNYHFYEQNRRYFGPDAWIQFEKELITLAPR